MKYIHAIRMIEINYQRPVEALYLYESDNLVLDIHDFIEVNKKTPNLKMIQSFFVGQFNSARDVKFDGMTFNYL